MKTYTIKKNARFSLPIFCIGMLSGLLFLCHVLHIHVKTFLEPAWLDAVVYGVIAAVCIILWAVTKRCGLTLNKDGLVYKPIFGASRNLAYSDLQKVCIGGKTYIIYTANGEKLISFDDSSTEDAGKIIAFLKGKGVKTEL